MVNVKPETPSNNVVLNAEDMFVFSGGIANNTTVNEDSYVFVSKGGIVNDTIINDWGEVDVESSGTANGTIINAGGNLLLSEGKAKAVGTLVNGGYFTVSSGGIASDTTVNNGGAIYVYEGGSIKGTTTVNQGGKATFEGGVFTGIEVHDGTLNLKSSTASEDPDYCFFDKITVDSGGSMIVSAGASASSATVNKGEVTVRKDGILDSATLTSATIAVSSGAIVSRVDLKEGAVMNVTSGGTLQNIYVSAGAVLTGVLREASQLKFYDGTLDLDISTAAPGNEFLIDDASFSVFDGVYDCTLTVSASQATGAYSLIEGATSFDGTITVKDTLGSTLGTLSVGHSLLSGTTCYTLAIDTNGLFVTIGTGNFFTGDVTGETKEITGDWTALGVNVNKDGILKVYGGGVARETSVHESGTVVVSKGGIAYDTEVDGYLGAVNVSSGGSASGVTLGEQGYLRLFPNAAAENVKVHAGGVVYAYTSTTVTDIVADEGARLMLTLGSKAYAKGTYAGTPFEIKETIDGFTVVGTLYVAKGGTAINTVVTENNYLEVSSTGLASKTEVKTGGHMKVISGGTAKVTNVTGGEFNVKEYGSAEGVTVGDLGLVHVSSGGIAGNVTVNKNGLVNVSEGGLVSGAVINDGGGFNVYGGGTLADFTVTAGGNLAVNGKITGKMTFETGANLAAFAGAIFDFDLTQTTPGADAFVNDLSFAMAQTFNYTLTVDGTEADGDYKLAEGATGFDKTISVVNTSGDTLGTLTVGATSTIGSQKYTLTLSTGGLLGLTIGDGGGGGTVDLTGDLDTYYDLEAGKVASSVNILAGGELDVENGALASQTTIQSGGYFYVYTGGVAKETAINSGGRAYVYEGEADATTVNYGGMLYFSDGKATQVTENGGCVEIYAGADIEFAPHEFTGLEVKDWNMATVHSGTIATDTNIGYGGYLMVYNGGSAGNTDVAAGGSLDVYEGGKATGASVAAGGGLYVYTGGSATGFVAEAGAYLELTVAPGTYVQGTYGGSAVETGNTVADYTVRSGCAVDVASDGLATNTTVETGGRIYVEEGGKAEGVSIAAGGQLSVYVGGSATGIVAEEGANLGLSIAPNTYAKGTLGGKEFEASDTLSDYTVHTSSWLEVFNGGSVDNITVDYRASLGVYGGKATQVRENGGYVYVEDGADVKFVANTFTGLEVKDYSDVTVHSGTTATDTKLSEVGVLHVYKGGFARGTVLDSAGYLNVSSGGLASATTVNKEGGLYVSEGGVARDTTVKNLGDLYVYEHGTAEGVTVEAGGNLIVFSGGKLSGKAAFEMGAFADFDDGAIIDFDLRKTTTLDPALVNDLSFVGTAAVKYTLTVDGTQASGTYNLADGADGFSKAITVMNQFGDEYGTLAVGGTLSTVFADYTLNLSGGALTLDLVAKAVADTTPPVVTNVQLSTLEFTNQNVTVTADFTDDVAVKSKLYKIDDGAWQDYDPVTGVVVTENATVYFKAVDTSDNESDVVPCDVPIIDKVPPTITITPSTTEPAASVTLGAVCEDETCMSSILQYRIGDGAWQKCTGPVTVTENTTVSFKTFDAAGNETIESYAVTNIISSEPDTTPPVVSNVQASIMTPTNQDVIVTADFSDDVAVKSMLYKINDSTWQQYVDGVSMTENATVSFKAVDTSGNESEEVSYVVNNIDKVAPTITNIVPSTTDPTKSVTVMATFADDVALASKQYKIGDGVWQDYDPAVGVPVTENTTVSFHATDTAGNEENASYAVTNIDTSEPDNKPDNGWNDYLYDKKKGWNTDENIAKFASNTITGNGEISLDVVGTIDFEDMHNMFGNDGTNVDTGDVGKIIVTTAAKVSFTVKSTADGTFYLYKDGLDKKGNRAQIQVGKVTVKKGKVATLGNICLEVGVDYYASMVAKNVKKEGLQGLYNVNVVDSTIFVDADDGWNNAATNKPVVENPAPVARGVKTIKLDNTDMINGGDYNNFVGFSDPVDYAKLDLASTAYLSFDLAANGNAKFTLWKRNTNTGKLSKVGSAVTLKTKNGAQVAKSTKAQLLEVNDKYEYFISMESTDAVKGGSAYYNVSVNTVATRFFDSADGGENNWLFDKKKKVYNDDANLRTNTIVSPGDTTIILDNNPIGDGAFKNFVGYQDAVDYGKVVLTESGALSFQITALADVTFEIWQKGEDKKGKPIVTSLQKKTSVKVKDYSVGATVKTEALMLEAGEYYVSVTAKSTKSNEKGSAYYNLTALFSTSGIIADALAMPETASVASALAMPEACSLDMPETGLAASDLLGTQDAQSFGGYDTDVLADASVSSSFDGLDDQSGWLNIAKLA